MKVWKDGKPRDYYNDYERIEVKNAHRWNGHNWFETFRLPGDVYLICEPYHFQEVNAFLVIGSERALMIDTGLGFFNIKDIADELYDGEIILVNTHSHFDHIGCNSRFSEAYAFDDKYAILASKTGRTISDLGDQLEEKYFKYGYPEGFDPASYRVDPYEIKTIKEGHVFDLGDRSLKVYHTPGHSNDCIMLLDSKEGILFTGDMFYLGALYAHFHSEQYGHADIKAYAASMQRMSEIPGVKVLYPSHNKPIADPCKLKEASDGLKLILEDSAKAAGEVDSGHEYLEAGRELRRYIFDGFSVIYDGKDI